MGKESPDQVVERLSFTSTSNNAFELTYPDKSDRADLVTLRKTYQLDTLIQNCNSDFEKVKRVQSWVQSRWEHDGDNRPARSSALYILQEAEKGQRFRCVEYSLVANQCLSSLGFRVRNLGLMTKDVSNVRYGAGHSVNEVYIPDLKKWVLIDPQFDAMSMQNGIPLNAVELQNAIANDEDFTLINPNKTISKDDYQKWIGPYLYYFKISLNKGSVGIWDRIIGNKKQLTLVPVGAENPKVFQRLFRITTSYFTHSTGDFYPTP